jgi:hypothetical protein
MSPSSIRNTSVIADTTLSPSLLTHSEDTHVNNIMTATETPPAVFFPQQKYRKDSPLPVICGKVV